MSGLRVVSPGILSLLQDAGRRGHYRLGLTDGGPLDRVAYNLCNRLLQNPAGSAVIELSVGGARLQAEIDTFICLTGAPMALSVAGQERPSWRVVPVRAGDTIEIGHAQAGCRAYLGVADGFRVTPVFGSVATVVREQLGGLNGGPLAAGDLLPCPTVRDRRPLLLPHHAWPRYPRTATLRYVPGYQMARFSAKDRDRFSAEAYSITDRADRMGYRLEGAALRAEGDSMLSEGICLGAIQLPPDGRPIVLLNDRQTIGGYPKIGAVLSVDLGPLSHLSRGDEVFFTPISQTTARRVLLGARIVESNRPIEERPL